MPGANLPRRTVLTVREVSQYLRLHRSTIYRMLKKTQLPAFRVGSDWRFMVEALDHWLSQAESGVFAGRAPSHRAPGESRS